MSTAAERLLERGLSATLAAVRRVRARVLALARRYRDLPTSIQLVRIRAEIARIEPDIARAIQAGILAAWVAAALKPAREIPADTDSIGRADESLQPFHLPSPFQPTDSDILSQSPGSPFLPIYLAPPGDDPARPVRWPAIEAAARDLLSRRVVTPGTFATLAQDAKQAAFTVAGVMTADAIDATRDAVAHDLISGGTLREFRRRVGAALDAAGLSEPQVETTYRTQTGLARSAGLRTVLDHPLVSDEFPYVAWHATHDGRVRPDHLAMETAGIDGTNVFRCDDPELRRVWPPAGYRCRCHIQPLSLEDAAEAGVREARVWLRTGEPPAQPAFVESVPVILPKGWPTASDGRVKAAV